jgi:hypothetical protein
VQTFGVNLKKRSKFCPRFLFRQEAEANIGRAFFSRFQEEAVQAQHSFCCQVEANTAIFYAIMQRQILAALSFTLSSRGRITGQVFFSVVKKRQILAALSFSSFKQRQYRPSILLRYHAEAITVRAFFYAIKHADANTGRAFFYSIKQRQILSPIYFTLSSRGKYCPSFLLLYQVEANTGHAFFYAIKQCRGKYCLRFFYAIKQRQILAAHSAFLHPLDLVGELLLDVDLGICLLEVFLSKPE